MKDRFDSGEGTQTTANDPPPPVRREFAVAPMARTAWLLLPAIALPLVLVSMLPPHGSLHPAPAWLAAVALLLAGLWLSMRRRRILVEDGVLTVAATLYTYAIPLADLDLEQARILGLEEHTQFRPARGLNRFGTPGLRAGYYILRNGRRAFCLLTSADRVLVLPQRDGRVMLLTPQAPDAMLEHLRALAAPRPAR